MSHKNLLLISTSSWYSPYWFRRQHFARLLALEGWRVVYMNPQTSVTRVFLERGVAGLFSKDHLASLEPSPELPALRIFRPPMALPFHVRSPTGSRLNKSVLRRRLMRVAKTAFDGEPYVQVFYNPSDVQVLNRAMPAVYEIVDKFEAYPEFARMIPYIASCHQRACAESLRIVATAPSLLPDGFSHKARVIPNGVDHELFSGGWNLPCPADLEALPAPRAVYAGALLDWFDYDLLRETANRLPAVQFVVLGFPERDFAGFPENVHYLGKRHQAELPAYYGHSDVGIIPFRRNDLTRHVNPLKLYEYLSAGLPCVSTPMEPIEPFVAEGVLALAADAPTFAEAITRQLRAANNPEPSEARRRIARQHAWPELAKDFIQALSVTDE